MTYNLNEPLFKPDHVEKPAENGHQALGDRQGDSVYVYTDDIVLLVNVALATGRPLLVCGSPGSGKSSLARSIAKVQKWDYFDEVITPRTQARDLLWQFDAVERLRDAQARELKPMSQYVKPRALWKAFAATKRRAVVLLDEIDKADPDVPNSLLVALGALRFTVTETGRSVSANAALPPLVVITTNDERELPKPFMRRCVVLTLPPPDVGRLEEIAQAHDLGSPASAVTEMANKVVDLADAARSASRAEPSAAEYLDALRACRQFSIKPNSAEWKAIISATLIKRGDDSSARA